MAKARSRCEHCGHKRKTVDDICEKCRDKGFVPDRRVMLTTPGIYIVDTSEFDEGPVEETVEEIYEYWNELIPSMLKDGMAIGPLQLSDVPFKYMSFPWIRPAILLAPGCSDREFNDLFEYIEMMNTSGIAKIPPPWRET